MNNEWKEFLHTQKAVFDSEFDVSFPGQHDSLSVETIHPLAYLSVLEVAGSDAQKFLQGQTTCNFDQIDTERGALGAFCSAKGRVISSFIAVKHDAGFLLILPADLIETVKKRLQFYVLRAAVNLTVLSDSFTVLGINTQNRLASNLPEANFHAAPLGEKGVILKWPSVKHRFLMVAPFEEARRFWLDVQTAHGVKPSSTRAWQLCEFVDGIPWLNRRTTEQYIPQWLNLDILGGIHFNKGCYTGQEIIARTHYLGKPKRRLHRAECQCAHPPEAGEKLIATDSEAETAAGWVVSAVWSENGCKLFAVLDIGQDKEKKLSTSYDKKNLITILD